MFKNDLPQEKQAIQDLFLNLKTENETLKNENLILKQEKERLDDLLRLLRRNRFASSSEKWVSQEQLVFNEIEEEFKKNESEEEETIEVKGFNKKKRGKRKPLPDFLKREEVVVDLNPEEKFCKNGFERPFLGEDSVEKLNYEPAKLHVTVFKKKKYGSCPCCKEEVITAELPAPMNIIPKSYATPSLLAALITSKYVDHLPLYRQEKIFSRLGIDLPRNTMARWMIAVSEKLRGLFNVAHADLVESFYLNMDETRIQVLNEEGRAAEATSYMWVTGRQGDKPIVLFFYRPTRSGSVPVELLDGFSGYLQVDGYAGYNEVCNNNSVIRLGCMDHLRRYFFQASKSSNSNKTIGKHVLSHIQKLYKIEEQIKDKPPDEKCRLRNEREKPILDKIKLYIDEKLPKTAPQTLSGKALLYAKNEWENIIRYLDDGRLSISNSFVENKIRPFALGRKNWLFSSTVEGAEASQILYSLIETAKANNVNPHRYLQHVLENISYAETEQDLKKLLPYNMDKNLIS